MYLLLILFLIGLYFLPTIVGYSRKVRNADVVMIINLFLGWTFIGWVVALAMSGRDATKKNP